MSDQEVTNFSIPDAFPHAYSFARWICKTKKGYDCTVFIVQDTVLCNNVVATKAQREILDCFFTNYLLQRENAARLAVRKYLD